MIFIIIDRIRYITDHLLNFILLHLILKIISKNTALSNVVFVYYILDYNLFLLSIHDLSISFAELKSFKDC